MFAPGRHQHEVLGGSPADVAHRIGGGGTQEERLRVISVLVFNLCKLIVGGIVFVSFIVKTAAEERGLCAWAECKSDGGGGGHRRTCYCSLRWVSRNRLVFSWPPWSLQPAHSAASFSSCVLLTGPQMM